MKKPLKLLIYPQPIANNPVTFRDISTGRETTSMFYRDGGCLTLTPPPLDKSKRLTDAELAAEFHLAVSDFQATTSLYLLFEDVESEQKVNDARDWMFCMEHFATLPHYDEQP